VFNNILAAARPNAASLQFHERPTNATVETSQVENKELTDVIRNYLPQPSAPPVKRSGPNFDLKTSIVPAFLVAPPKTSLLGIQLPLPSSASADIVMCSTSKHQILGASVPAIIYLLTTRDAVSDFELVDTFFLCFRFFAGPMDVFHALVDCYKGRGSPNIGSDQPS